MKAREEAPCERSPPHVSRLAGSSLMDFMFYVGIGFFVVVGIAIPFLAKEIAAHTQKSPAPVDGPRTAVPGPQNSVDGNYRLAVAAGGLVGMMLLIYGCLPSNETSSASSPSNPERPQLSQIRIGALNWTMGGFGTVMIATLRIDNNNTLPIKDVEVTCIHSGKSGTPVSQGKRTIYERIEAHSYIYVRELNMGFIHTQATWANCFPSAFVG